jgi:hypothetical protein
MPDKDDEPSPSDDDPPTAAADDRPGFEGHVIRILSRLGVLLETCEDWDKKEMTDFVVMNDGAGPMPFRTEVQLTKQGGSLHKLEKFIRISERRPGVLRVYIVPAGWHRPADSAHAVRRILRYLRRARKPGIRAFFLRDPVPGERGLQFKQFDPRRRADVLRRRCDPANARRREGVIAAVDLQRLRLEILDGESGATYVALLGDAEGRLGASLKRRQNDPERKRSSPVGWRVSFVPHVEESGPAIGRLRALSVIFPERP